MSSRVLAAAFAFAFGADAQACFADTAAPTAPIEKLFAAFNADDGARLAEAYAPNAVIVDEFAPFVWRGAAAGTSFWTSLLALRKAMKLSAIHAVHGPLAFVQYDDAKTTAFVVASTTLTARHAGTLSTTTGQWLFVVKKIGGTWLIESSSWTRTSSSDG